jgi:DNA-binding PadR family transcriptional regulator
MIRDRLPASFLPLAPDALAILLALAARPQHGYGIIGDVAARSDGTTVLQTGALYRLLRRLLRDTLIEECPPPRGEGADVRRRFYRPTPLGRAVVEAEIARMARLVRAARQTEAGKHPRLV